MCIMNEVIPWSDGVQNGGVIKKEHDWDTLHRSILIHEEVILTLLS